MKIKIIEVSNRNDPEELTLEECGFLVGDIVDVDGSFQNGDVCVLVIRDTDFIRKGDAVSVAAFEYEVVEE